MIPTTGTSWRSRARVLFALPFAAIVILTACTDGAPPLSPSASGGFQRLAVRPQYIMLGGAYHSEPINRIHLTARAIPSQQVFADTILDVSPTASSWDVGLDLRLPDDAASADVVVTIELINHSPSGDAVQWSGMSAPISVTVGGTPASPPPVDVFPGPPANLTVTGVTIAPDSAVLIEGDSAMLTAGVTGAAGTPLIVWSTLDPTIAAVSAGGAVRGLRNGSARVVAQVGPKADTAVVRFTQRVASVNVIQDSVSLASIGEQATVTVRALDPRGDSIAGTSFSYTIRDGAVLEQSGASSFRARANGRTYVVATSAAQPALRDSVLITVAQRIATTSITPPNTNVSSLGAVVSYTAAAQDALGNQVAAAITWSSDNTAVATVDGNGVAHTVSNGTAHITAAFAGGPNAVATLNVAQVAASVSITPATASLTSIGDTTRLGASARDANGNAMPATGLTWSTSNASIATVDPSGLVHAVATGTVTITAHIGGASGSAQVGITQRAAHVAVSPTDAIIPAIGATTSFTAAVADAHNAPIPNAAVTWRSTNTAVATVDATGSATAQANGTTFIVAESGGVRDSVQLTVNQAVAHIVIDAFTDSLAISDTMQLSASAFDANNHQVTGASITWSGSADGVATVTPSGLVVGRDGGVVDISASSGNAAAVAHLRVYQGPPAQIAITPHSLTLDVVNHTGTLSALARDAHANILPSAPVVWTSLDPAVATVDTHGVVTAVGDGTARIRASSGVAADTATVHVTIGQPNLRTTSFAFTPADSFRVGASYPVRLVIRNIGNGAARSTSVAMVATAVGSATPLLSMNLPLTPLGPGDSALVLTTVPLDTLVIWPDSVQGVLIVDASNAVDESDETDNAVARIFHLVQRVARVESDTAVSAFITDTVQLHVHAYDRFNRPLLNRTAAWRSLDPEVAAVDAATGRVRATGVGDARIEVVIEGVADTSIVRYSAGAGLRTWTGAVSAAWSNAGNWSPALTPTAADSVYIPPVIRQPVLDAAVHIAGLRIPAGTILDMNNDSLVNSGHATIDGIATNGTLIMTGHGKRLSAVIVPRLILDDSTVVTSRLHAGSLTVRGGRFVAPPDSLVVLDSLNVINDGLLVMSDPASIVTVLGPATFNMMPSAAGTMTAGTLRVAGNFTVGGGAPSFSPSLAHRTVLIGDGGTPQMVSFANYGPGNLDSHFNYLDIEAPAGVRLATSTEALRDITIRAGAGVFDGAENETSIEADANIFDQSGQHRWRVPATFANAASPQLPDSMDTHLYLQNSGSLQGDLALSGDLTIYNNPIVSLNGHRVHVGRYLNISNGELIARGHLVAESDLLISANGFLTMHNDADSVVIRGKASISAGNEGGKIDAGRLLIAGDFFTGTNGRSFIPAGTHVTELNGTTAQRVSFGAPGTAGNQQHFNHLRISNPEEVAFITAGVALGDVTIAPQAGFVDGNTGTVTLGGSLVDSTFSGHWNHASTVLIATGTPTLPSDMHGDVTIRNTSAMTLASNLTLHGILTIDGGLGSGLNLGTSVLHTDGITIRNSAVLSVMAGHAIINGDLVTTGEGLDMSDNAGVVTVLDETVFGGGDGSGRLTHGTLELEGPLTVLGTTPSLAASPTHVTVLQGASAQHISFEHPDNMAGQHFGELHVIGSGGVIFDAPSAVAGDVQVDASVPDVVNPSSVAVAGTITDPAHHWLRGYDYEVSAFSVTPSDNLRIGSTYPLHLTVGNIGPENTPGGRARITIETADGLHTVLLAIDTVVPVLTIGQSITTDIMVTLPSSIDWPDSVNVIFAVDPDGALTELATTNNVRELGTIHLLPALGAYPLAITKTWTGAVNSSWANGNNWSPAGAPTQIDSVLIPVTAQRQPEQTTATDVGGIVVESGAHLHMTASLSTHGDVYADGLIDGNGALKMLGTDRTLRGHIGRLQMFGSTSANGDIELTDDLELNAGTFNVNGKTVHVAGSLYRYDGAHLEMQNADDDLVIEGNASFFAGDDSGYMIEGRMTLGGNLSVYDKPTAFATSGNFELVLDGTAQQLVSLSQSGVAAQRIRNLRVTNPQGVSFAANTVIDGDVTTFGPVTGSADVEVSVRGNIDVNGELRWLVPNTRLYFGNGTLPAVMQTNLTIDGAFILLTQPLSITGNLTVKSGRFDTGSERVAVGGAFTTTDSGVLRMLDADGTLDVTGAVLFNGGDERNMLTAGTLIARGDFTTGTLGNQFVATNLHATRFAGSSRQNISMGMPALDQSRFNNVIIENANGVYMSASDVYITGILDITGALNISEGRLLEVYDDVTLRPTARVTNNGTFRVSLDGLYRMDGSEVTGNDIQYRGLRGGF